jgi:hypothetical protein
MMVICNFYDSNFKLCVKTKDNGTNYSAVYSTTCDHCQVVIDADNTNLLTVTRQSFSVCSFF